jgi:hypothetical protein
VGITPLIPELKRIKSRQLHGHFKRGELPEIVPELKKETCFFRNKERQ